VRPAREIKVFWFFFSKKNRRTSFSEEKEAKRLLFLGQLGWIGQPAGHLARPAEEF
jgi:hypothetical protein